MTMSATAVFFAAKKTLRHVSRASSTHATAINAVPRSDSLVNVAVACLKDDELSEKLALVCFTLGQLVILAAIGFYCHNST